jgi:hypothetical protein
MKNPILAAVFLLGALVAVPVLARAAMLFNNYNEGNITMGWAASPTFSLTEPAMVTKISTYHWNEGRGEKPGTIELAGPGGTTYGPFAAQGQPAGKIANVTWVATVSVLLPVGTYTIIDSSRATWANNAQSGGKGFAEVVGSYVTAASPKSTPTHILSKSFLLRPAPTPTPTPLNLAAAKLITASKPTPTSVSIEIIAKFVESEFATHYTVDVEGLTLVAMPAKVRYSWNLFIVCVDPGCQAKPASGYIGPALDNACNNSRNVSSTASEFVWHHGDRNGCNHNWQGHSGHQASISVEATTPGGIGWKCIAHFYGSNSGTSKGDCVRS